MFPLRKTFICIIVLLLWQSYSLFAQEKHGGLAFVVGGYVHEAVPVIVFRHGYSYQVVSPFVGLRYAMPGDRFSVFYRRSMNYGHTSNYDIRFLMYNYLGSDSSMDQIDRLDLFYRIGQENLGRMRLGIGYYRKRWFTLSYFTATEFLGLGSTASNFSGMSFSVAFDLSEVSVEFVKMIELGNGGFDVFSRYLYGVSVYRSFPLHLKGKSSGEGNFYTWQPWDHFFPFISMRLQPIKYYRTTNPDLFDPVGFVPGIGLGYYFPKYDASVIVSRDVWKRLIGGTHANDIIGYISTTNIMVKKYFASKKGEGKWVVGLGWHPIRNDNEPWRMGSRTYVDTQTGKEVTYTFPRFTNVYGLGYSVGYALNDHYELELRQIFPYLGDKSFTFWYSGIGVVYNFGERLSGE